MRSEYSVWGRSGEYLELLSEPTEVVQVAKADARRIHKRWPDLELMIRRRPIGEWVDHGAFAAGGR